MLRLTLFSFSMLLVLTLCLKDNKYLQNNHKISTDSINDKFFTINSNKFVINNNKILFSKTNHFHKLQQQKHFNLRIHKPFFLITALIRLFSHPVSRKIGIDLTKEIGQKVIKNSKNQQKQDISQKLNKTVTDKGHEY